MGVYSPMLCPTPRHFLRRGVEVSIRYPHVPAGSPLGQISSGVVISHDPWNASHEIPQVCVCPISPKPLSDDSRLSIPFMHPTKGAMWLVPPLTCVLGVDTCKVVRITPEGIHPNGRLPRAITDAATQGYICFLCPKQDTSKPSFMAPGKIGMLSDIVWLHDYHADRRAPVLCLGTIALNNGIKAAMVARIHSNPRREEHQQNIVIDDLAWLSRGTVSISSTSVIPVRPFSDSQSRRPISAPIKTINEFSKRTQQWLLG